MAVCWSPPWTSQLRHIANPPHGESGHRRSPGCGAVTSALQFCGAEVLDFVGSFLPASWVESWDWDCACVSAISWTKHETKQLWNLTGSRYIYYALMFFCKKCSAFYPLHKSVYPHHLEFRGRSFFWGKVLGRQCLQLMGKQVSPLTVFTALWLCKLHTGPLVPAVKVKRHEIKSDPTPLGFEGTSVSILHENLFGNLLILSTEFISHPCW